MDLNETEPSNSRQANLLASLLAADLGQALKTELSWETVFLHDGVRIYLYASQHELRLFTQHSNEQIRVIIETSASFNACLGSVKKALADQRPDLAEYFFSC